MSTHGRPEEREARHHLLVTNDFPPKIGGIQSFLWEMWRRLPPASFTVLTIEHPGSAEFDAAQEFRIERLGLPMLLPTPSLARRIRSLAGEVGASLVVFDPAVPVGLLGPRLGLPYAVVLHGAEVSVPGRLPISRTALARVLRDAQAALVNSTWVGARATEVAAPGALHLIPATPGVDHTRFVPLDTAHRESTRRRLGLPEGAELVLGVGRLVARKGALTLLDAVSQLAPTRPGLCLAIAGTGREAERLARRAAATEADVRLLGRVSDVDLPLLYGCADVFVQPTLTRWGGLEQEGFGIVFLEAAACGIPVVAGRSGGSAEAVLHGVTGLVLDSPGDPDQVAGAIRGLLDDHALRTRMGHAARQRVEDRFTYDRLAASLVESLAQMTAAPTGSTGLPSPPSPARGEHPRRG